MSFDENSYVFNSGELSENGIFAVMDVGSNKVIQFRSDSEYSILNKCYTMEFGSKVITETVKKKTVEKVVPDYDTVIFTPVKITATDCFATDGKTYTFVR